jgi:hypothetical protein
MHPAAAALLLLLLPPPVAALAGEPPAVLGARPGMTEREALDAVSASLSGTGSRPAGPPEVEEAEGLDGTPFPVVSRWMMAERDGAAEFPSRIILHMDEGGRVLSIRRRAEFIDLETPPRRPLLVAALEARYGPPLRRRLARADVGGMVEELIWLFGADGAPLRAAPPRRPLCTDPAWDPLLEGDAAALEPAALPDAALAMGCTPALSVTLSPATGTGVEAMEQRLADLATRLLEIRAHRELRRQQGREGVRPRL